VNKKEYEEYRNSEHWKYVRGLILERDNKECKFCGSDDKLNVHHIRYDNLGKERLGDLITLCERCHTNFHEPKLDEPDDSPEFSTIRQNHVDDIENEVNSGKLKLSKEQEKRVRSDIKIWRKRFEFNLRKNKIVDLIKIAQDKNDTEEIKILLKELQEADGIFKASQ